MSSKEKGGGIVNNGVAYLPKERIKVMSGKQNKKIEGMILDYLINKQPKTVHEIYTKEIGQKLNEVIDRLNELSSPVEVGDGINTLTKSPDTNILCPHCLKRIDKGTGVEVNKGEFTMTNEKK